MTLSSLPRCGNWIRVRVKSKIPSVMSPLLIRPGPGRNLSLRRKFSINLVVGARMFRSPPSRNWWDESSGRNWLRSTGSAGGGWRGGPEPARRAGEGLGIEHSGLGIMRDLCGRLLSGHERRPGSNNDTTTTHTLSCLVILTSILVPATRFLFSTRR